MNASGAGDCGPSILTPSGDPTPIRVAVAIDDDTAVVGDWDVGAAAYVFRWTGSSWTEEAVLTPSDGATPSDDFGISVAIDADTVLVAAPGDAVAGNAQQGAAYVFTRSGTTWTQQDRLTASDGAALQRFASAVALDQDRALVGSPFVDQAYVFQRSAGAWSERQILKAAEDAPAFGSAVALDDGTALVGAPSDDGAAPGAGAAYAFVEAGGAWTQQAKITAFDGADAETNDGFEGHLVIDADTAVVGAPFYDGPAGADQGAAYVFIRSAAGWTQQALLTASDAAPDDRLGFAAGFGADAAAIQGDTAILGAPFADAAYVFQRSGTSWAELIRITASDDDPATIEGFAGALDLDAGAAIVGANSVDGPGGENDGAAYVYTAPAWFQQDKLTHPDPDAGDLFGGSTAVSGDVILVSAPSDDNPTGIDAGAVHLFRRDMGSWTHDGTLTNPAFGLSGAVALDAQTALAGGFFFTYVYDLGDDDIPTGPDQKLTAPDAAALDEFADDLDVHADTAVAGADQGAAWMFGVADGCVPALVVNESAETVHESIQEAVDAAADSAILASTPAGYCASFDFGSTRLTLDSTKDIRQPLGASLRLSTLSVMSSLEGACTELYGDAILETDAAIRALGDRLLVGASGDVSLAGGKLETLDLDGLVQNDGRIGGVGAIFGDVVNDGIFEILGDSSVSGDYENNGTTTISGGVLGITGDLTGDGTLEGPVSRRRATQRAPGDTLSVLGDCALDARATLRMEGGGLVFCRGDWDPAIDENARFDLADAELHLPGIHPQTMEAMSVDVGPNEDALDQSTPRAFPIGTLRVGFGNQTVQIVDARDNDANGQSGPEAVYVKSLVIEAGATLQTNGARVYYESLALDGDVDDPDSLISIPDGCVGDLDTDGDTDVFDFATFAANFGTGAGATLADGDLDGDGDVDVFDFGIFATDFGCAPPPPDNARAGRRRTR